MFRPEAPPDTSFPGEASAAAELARVRRVRDLDDHALMLRVQAGDAAAFRVLYDRLAPRALRVAGVVCGGDVGRAQDAVQEGFLSVWCSRAQYQPERGSVQAWALSIIRYRAIDNLRHHARELRAREHVEGLVDTIAADDDVHRDALLRQDARDLRAGLLDLPAVQRDVIALAFFGELSHTEIAQHLGLPLGTVKSRMRLGLLALRHHTSALGRRAA